MKRNNYTLTSGILLVIAASICILMAIIYMFALFVSIQYIAMYGYEIAEVDKTFYIIEILSYAGMILFKVAQVVTFMLLGIKLINKGKKGVPTQNNKGLVITSLVLAYICAFIDLTAISFVESGLFLAAGIILSCGLGKKQDVQPQMIVNPQVNIVEANPQPINNVETQSKENTQNVNNDDNLSSQIKALQELKDKNVIDSSEYLKMLQKIVGITNNSTTSQNKVEKAEKKETKTTKAKKTTQKQISKDSKE